MSLGSLGSCFFSRRSWASSRRASRMRGPRRALYAVVFAVLLAWALHAGVDWDWEMPALSVIFFALGGAVLAQATKDSASRHRGRSARPAPKIHCVLCEGVARVGRVAEWRPSPRPRVSRHRLSSARRRAHLCVARAAEARRRRTHSMRGTAAATSAALSSISIVSVKAKPYEILAYCDIRRNVPNAALAAINKAVSLDPHDSDLHA